MDLRLTLKSQVSTTILPKREQEHFNSLSRKWTEWYNPKCLKPSFNQQQLRANFHPHPTSSSVLSFGGHKQYLSFVAKSMGFEW